MATKFQIRPWEPARDAELHNILYRPSDPQHHTGITVHCWGGWRWTHDGTEYRTNAEGCGLWVRRSTGDWSQSRGTGQFSLSRHLGTAIRQLQMQGLAPDPEPAAETMAG